MSKKQLKLILSIISLLIAAAGYYFQQVKTDPAAFATTSTSSSSVSSSTLLVPSSTEVAVTSTVVTNALVTHVADGDTISVLQDGEKDVVKIRLLGINTPESVDPRRPVECFGKEASAFTKQALDGQRIRLDEDPQADNVDKYGRFLRTVIKSDGANYNDYLVEQGYAYAYVSFPMSADRKAHLRRLELEAKTALRGLWNPSTCNGMK